jgi:hypothetical protein
VKTNAIAILAVLLPGPGTALAGSEEAAAGSGPAAEPVASEPGATGAATERAPDLDESWRGASRRPLQ